MPSSGGAWRLSERPSLSLSFPVLLDFDLTITFTLDQVSKDCESSDPGGARVVQSVHNGFVFVTSHPVFLALIAQ